jgi:hypothetical protein
MMGRAFDRSEESRVLIIRISIDRAKQLLECDEDNNNILCINVVTIYLQ